MTCPHGSPVGSWGLLRAAFPCLPLPQQLPSLTPVSFLSERGNHVCSPVRLPVLPHLRLAFGQPPVRKEGVNLHSFIHSFDTIPQQPPVCQVPLEASVPSRAPLWVPEYITLSQERRRFNDGQCLETKEGPTDREVLRLVMGRWKKFSGTRSL